MTHQPRCCNDYLPESVVCIVVNLAINDFAPQNVPAVETIEYHSCKCLHLIVLCGREDPFHWQPRRDKVRDLCGPQTATAPVMNAPWYEDVEFMIAGPASGCKEKLL
jgi:hypothetical protein